MPTLTWIDSFQHGVVNAQFYGTNAGAYDNVQGTGSPFTYVTGRATGQFALQVTQDGSNQTRVSKNVAAGNRTLVDGFYVKAAAPPAADSRFWNCVASSNGSLVFEASTGKIVYNSNGGGSPLKTSTNYCDGNWHRVDVKFVTSANPYTLDLQVDGSAQTQHSGGGTVADITRVDLGHQAATGALAVAYADLVRSVTAGDYPIGAHQCLALIPSADGTHNWASNNMGPNGGGTASSVTTLYQEVDDWASAATADTTTYIQYANTTATSTEYAEVTLADAPSATIWAARAVAGIFSASTTANSATTRIVDGSGATVLDLYVGDQSDTSLRHQATMLASITDTTTLNALKYRVGFPTDSSPAPRWSALMIDYAKSGDPVSSGATDFVGVIPI